METNLEFSENLKKYIAGLEKVNELHAAGKVEEADQFSENELDELWSQLTELDIVMLNSRKWKPKNG